MDLHEWRRHGVFMDTTSDGVCRGRLTVSLAAGDQGESHPVISDEGRRFLLEQLQRLTLAHVQALFAAARVDRLGDDVGAWVEAFQAKVHEIRQLRCQPAR